MSLSMSRDKGLEQQAHAVCISTVKDSFLNRPCTKGVANASTAQAAKISSPVEKRTLWGVFIHGHRVGPSHFSFSISKQEDHVSFEIIQNFNNLLQGKIDGPGNGLRSQGNP